MTTWKSATPVFPVSDVEAAVVWYRDALGFEAYFINRDDSAETSYACLLRDQVSVHLVLKDEAARGTGGPITTQFVIDSDIDEYFKDVTVEGARVLREPADQHWGSRDFIIADPDGNVLVISRPRA